MTLVQHLMRLGGVASRKVLVDLTSRAELDRALADGLIMRDARGRYSLSFADEALKVANARSATVSHRSAAGYWGWAMKVVPPIPQVTVPRKRTVTAARRRGVEVTWSDLAEGEIVRGVTNMRRTVVDCLRSLPFDEALCIADSALRMGSVTKAEMVELAAGIRGSGAVQARRVAALADGRAANPFESALRAIAVDVPGLTLVPQLPVTTRDGTRHPDLADEALRVIVEAESFEWHGKRKALQRDCRRYNGFTLAGWFVVRFAWEDVMLDPTYVAEVLTELVRKRAGTMGRRAA